MDIGFIRTHLYSFLHEFSLKNDILCFNSSLYLNSSFLFGFFFFENIFKKKPCDFFLNNVLPFFFHEYISSSSFISDEAFEDSLRYRRGLRVPDSEIDDILDNFDGSLDKVGFYSISQLERRPDFFDRMSFLSKKSKRKITITEKMFINAVALTASEDRLVYYTIEHTPIEKIFKFFPFYKSFLSNLFNIKHSAFDYFIDYFFNSSFLCYFNFEVFDFDFFREFFSSSLNLNMVFVNIYVSNFIYNKFFSEFYLYRFLKTNFDIYNRSNLVKKLFYFNQKSLSPLFRF